MGNLQPLFAILLAIIIFENFPKECRAWNIFYRPETSSSSTTTTTTPATTATETSPPTSSSPTSISSLGTFLFSNDGGFNLVFAVLVILCLFVILLNHSCNQIQDDGVRDLPAPDIHDVKAPKSLLFLLLTSSS
ncbi:hypothetical protein EGR_10320 [Echinococcus granulosus]|uniref:Transmembrane protein n=1 Tax=Echinococcus granulosus TaxID=6210 RepID=W6U1A5_ECHGR|nr:hypothetical protein EGR_10320 [Echinococcus granulosus]EUB54813.1 hypothetical protein EGR_10320 [Echinococcus granulosus]